MFRGHHYFDQHHEYRVELMMNHLDHHLTVYETLIDQHQDDPVRYNLGHIDYDRSVLHAFSNCHDPHHHFVVRQLYTVRDHPDLYFAVYHVCYYHVHLSFHHYNNLEVDFYSFGVGP